MNGVLLRMNRSGTSKKKPHYSPCIFSPTILDVPGLIRCRPQLENFLDSTNPQEQVDILNTMSRSIKTNEYGAYTQILVMLFQDAPPKHPIKNYIIRFIGKKKALEPSFVSKLAEDMEEKLLNPNKDFFELNNLLFKVSSCMDNFPAGIKVLEKIKQYLPCFFLRALCLCSRKLVYDKENKLLPSEKSYVFTLIHNALQTLFNLIPKPSGLAKNCNTAATTMDISDKRQELLKVMKIIMVGDEVPMDTKNICGYIILTFFFDTYSTHGWDYILADPAVRKKRIWLQLYLTTDAEHLAIYLGLATLAPLHFLRSANAKNEPAITDLVRRIFELNIKNSSNPVFTLGVARSMFQVSKNMHHTSYRHNHDKIVKLLLSFIWEHLEHNIDSVRHLTVQITNNVIQHYSSPTYMAIMPKIIAEVQKADKNWSGYYTFVKALTHELGTDVVCESIPELFKTTLEALSQDNLFNAAKELLQTYLHRRLYTCDACQINEEWVDGIVSYVFVNELSSPVLNVLEGMLSVAAQAICGTAEYIIQKIRRMADANHHNKEIEVMMMLLSVVHKAGIRKLPGEGYKGILTYDVLNRAAVDASEQTRIKALYLITDSAKRTEIFNQKDFDFILHYLKYNINDQSSNFRQMSTSLLKKFMQRFQESFRAIQREGVVETHEMQKVQCRYKVFLYRLRMYCLDCLVPHANYSRRYVALTVISTIDTAIPTGYQLSWHDNDLRKILRYLEDNYEAIKNLALLILYKFKDLPNFKNQLASVNTFARASFEVAMTQVSGVKPTECQSAAAKLEFVRVHLPETIPRLQDMETGHIPEETSFRLIVHLLYRLRYEVELAQRNILAAAAKGPMYGAVLCITRTYKDIDAQKIASSLEWKFVTSEVIHYALEVSKAVCPIVNNSSPEGHLPNDQGPGLNHLETAEGPVEECPVTAQMLLLCAWRSIKEVSLLLGQLTSQLVIDSDETHGTLDYDQLVTIGDHFSELLTETKHRGAFEQAYVGYTMLLARLWGSNIKPVSELPSTWLAKLMEDIAHSEINPGLATRRSAGVPYIVMALVTTELQVTGHPKVLNQVMDHLLKLAEGSNPDPHAPPDNVDIHNAETPPPPGEVNEPGPSTSSVKPAPITSYIARSKEQKTTSKMEFGCPFSDKYEQGDSDEDDGKLYGLAALYEECNNKQSADLAIEDELIRDEIALPEGVIEHCLVSVMASLTTNDGPGSTLPVLDCTELDEATPPEPTPSTSQGAQAMPDLDNCDLEISDSLAQSIEGFLAYKKHAEEMPEHPLPDLSALDEEFEDPQPEKKREEPEYDAATNTRVQCLNILRALYRNTTLGDAIANRVGDGLILSLKGLDSLSWLSRLRIQSHEIFQTSLYSILLILARLYPSALEGTVSNLKLVRFIPHVVNCGSSHSLKIRQLAAMAAVTLVSPEMYLRHLRVLFEIIDERTDVNLCHGMLLQIKKLLENKPAKLHVDQANFYALKRAIARSSWILTQSLGFFPCYPLLDELVQIFNLLLWKFKEIFTARGIIAIELFLKMLLDDDKDSRTFVGRDRALYHCGQMYIIFALSFRLESLEALVEEVLTKSDTVIHSMLDYLIVLHDCETWCNVRKNKFLDHLEFLFDSRKEADKRMLNNRKSYLALLTTVVARQNLYVKQKALALLVQSSASPATILAVTHGYRQSGKVVVGKLIDMMLRAVEHDAKMLRHVYMCGLFKFAFMNIDHHDTVQRLARIVRALFLQSTPGNIEVARENSIMFLQMRVLTLMTFPSKALSRRDEFAVKAPVIACIAILLEDECEEIRRKAAYLTSFLSREEDETTSSFSGDILRKTLGNFFNGQALRAMYFVLALLDFKASVSHYEELSEEARVFDPNDQSNVFLEEHVWTNSCCKLLRDDVKEKFIGDAVNELITDRTFYYTMELLCGKNFSCFKTLFYEGDMSTYDTVNPKVYLCHSLLVN